MEDTEVQAQLSARFKELPQKVRNAITSADVEKQLQTLAQTHKLHIDQWGILENEVMLTMLGFQSPSDLPKNLAREVGIQGDAAESLAADISAQVFAPIRAELEALTSAPAAAEPSESQPAPAPMPAEPATIAATPEAPPQEEASAPLAPGAAPAPLAPAEASAVSTPSTLAPAPAPATPPAPAPEQKVERAPSSATYAPSTPSHERTEIEGDPYREQIS